MEFVLFFGIILLACIAYILSGRDILSPWFVSCCMFGLAVTIAILNIKMWGIIMEPLTVLLILCSLFCMGIGEVFGREIVNRPNSKIIRKVQFQLIEISKWRVILYLFFSLMICYYSYLEVVLKAQKVGFTGSGHLLNYARFAMQNPEIGNNVILALARFAIIGMGYIFIFSWINNYYFFNKKRFIKKYHYYLLPLIPWVVVVILSTGRSEFIRLFQMVIFLFFLGWSMKYPKKKLSFFKAAIIGIAAIGVFFAIFQMAGLLTGKTYMTSGWNMFSIYSGSSIVGLNEGIKTVNMAAKKGIGAYTFMGFRDVLARFGFDIDKYVLDHPFILFLNNTKTNVYTSLMQYYSDFGFVGTLVIQILMGFFFAFLYMKVKRRCKFDLFILIYVFLAHALVRQIIAAEFLARYFSVTHSFILFFILIGYWVFVYKKRKALDSCNSEEITFGMMYENQ